MRRWLRPNCVLKSIACVLCVEWTEAELVNTRTRCSVQCVRQRTVLQYLERMRAVAVALPLPLCCRLSFSSALYQASSVQATAPLQPSWVLAIACTALSRANLAFRPPFSKAERLLPLHGVPAGPGGHWPGLHPSSLHDAADCTTMLNTLVPAWSLGNGMSCPTL